MASLALWLLWTFFPSLRILPGLIYAEWLVCVAIMILFAIVAKVPAGSIFEPDADAKKEAALPAPAAA